MKISTAELRHNPFRNLDRYPLQREKIDALKRSIRSTTFWDNLLARKAPNGAGGFEIAYGHNRLAALKEMKIREIDIPIRNIDDTHMAQIMAHENMEEWGHSSAVEQETIRTIVEGFGSGRIKIPPPRQDKGAGHGGTRTIRVAPSFLVSAGAESKFAYTAGSLADFLGWKSYKVEAALGALALIEEGLAREDDFAGLSTKQAETVTAQTRRALKETKEPRTARAVAKGLAQGMKRSVGKTTAEGKDKTRQDVTIHTARHATDTMIGARFRKLEKPKKLPPIDDYAWGIIKRLAKVFEGPDDAKLKAVIDHRDALTKDRRRGLVSSLRRLAKDATTYADRLEA